MNKKVFVIVLISLLISINSVSSVRRVISSSSDNIYTMIHNGNGNIWEATSANIQSAINDLDNNSGIVWLPLGNKTFFLLETIVVWENIILEMNGCEFKLPNGTDCNVVELKDGAGIRNGVIDVSGHQYNFETGLARWTTNSSFLIPHSCIFLNASSCIDLALIVDMNFDSINDGYQWDVNDPMIYYGDPRQGRGHGIRLYASDTDIPQWIYGVTVKRCQFRGFQHGIFLQNERSNTGTNTAHIDRNHFENSWMIGCNISVNISRNTNADRDNCSVGNNFFDMIQCQTGKGSSLGGEEITIAHLRVDGKANTFKNWISWDTSYLHGDTSVEHNTRLSADSCYTFLHGAGMGMGAWDYYNDDWNDSGTRNTIISLFYGTFDGWDAVGAETEIFGWTSTSGSLGRSAEDTLRGSAFIVTTGNGTADNITVYITVVDANFTSSCGIWDNSTGAYIGKTEEKTIYNASGWHWETYNISGTVNIVNNTEYLLCMWTEAKGGVGEYSYCGYQAEVDQLRIYDSETYNYASFPDPHAQTSDGATGNVHKIYCSYTLEV